MNKAISKSHRGFTLVELLIAISLIGILTGVTLSIINPKKQRNVAEDAVRQSNLEKYALGIESYANANGSYPADIVDTTPVDNKPDDAEVATFISKIPKDEPTTGVIYPYAVAADKASFGVYVVKASDATQCYKYLSIWGKIKECTPLAKCPGVTDVSI